MKIRNLFETDDKKKEAPKPRNFVAKNAMKTTSGAGAHRDKKKEKKQGYEKHKGKELVSESNKFSPTDDVVGFTINSEKAYNVVMRQFGDYIDFDEDEGVMYVPEKMWPKVEMAAFDADGEGATRVEDDSVDESDISGLMHAARNMNRSFIITAELAEGGVKKFRVKAQSENVAVEKFQKHASMAKILDVKEENE